MGFSMLKALSLPLFAALLASTSSSAQEVSEAARDQMIAAIEDHARSASGALEEGTIDPAILDAMRQIPRDAFVPEDVRPLAYEDTPLPIGYSQTISQPYIVALMTDLLDVGPGDTVLEIGTGSGYQAAVLSPLVEQVYSIEIVPELGERAAGALEEQGLGNVETRVADGYYGWPEAAPFDGIVVTAAAGQIPPPLVEQLDPGGRMVIPIGTPFSAQMLMLVEKQEDGSITTRQILPVQFVPFTGAGGG
jgi:protein-L-isoaspartate(D-aspartate) O-methyltransferase